MKILILVSVLISSISAFSFYCEKVQSSYRTASKDNPGNVITKTRYVLYRDDGSKASRSWWWVNKTFEDCLEDALVCEPVTDKSNGRWVWKHNAVYSPYDKDSSKLDPYKTYSRNDWDEGIRNCDDAIDDYIDIAIEEGLHRIPQNN